MSAHIHPAAHVDAGAELGAGVRVGPGAVIEAGCVIGDDCEIQAHAIICRGTTLGAGNLVGYGAVLGAEPQDLAYRGAPTRVEIGSGNRIREHVTVHRATQEGGATRIGNDNFLMVGSHLGHDGVVGDRVILANHVLLGGFAQVGDGAFLGGATVVHQHTRVGTLAMTRGGTRLSQDVPPYFMAVEINTVGGVNRVGMRRAGISGATRRAIQNAYLLLYRSDRNTTQALEVMRARFAEPEIAVLADFIAGSKRGICRARKSARDAGSAEEGVVE